MPPIRYPQPYRIGEHEGVIERRERTGEADPWWKFKFGSAIILWVLLGIPLIIGIIMVVGWTINGARSSGSSGSGGAVLPSRSTTIKVDTSGLEGAVDRSLTKLEELERKAAALPAPPKPLAEEDPTAGMMPEQKRQYELWR